VVSERLGNDADIGDAGTAELVDHGGEDAEGNGLVGSQINGVVRMLLLLFDARGKVADVDRIIADVDELVFVNGDNNLLFDDGLDGFRLGDVDLNAGLEDGSGDHKDDEENQHHINERHHVDVGEGGLGGFGKLGHGDQ